MKTLTKYLFLNMPAESAYKAIRTADSSRHTADLDGAWSRRFSKEILNALLVWELEDNVGRYLVTEYSFRKINDSSCELTMSFQYDHFDETYAGLVLSEIIHGCIMLEFGYNMEK